MAYHIKQIHVALLIAVVFAFIYVFARRSRFEQFDNPDTPVPTPASDAYRLDLMKGDDAYDLSSLHNMQKDPGKRYVDMLLSQQYTRRYIVSVMNDRQEKATEKLRLANIEIEKAKIRTAQANEHVENAKADVDKKKTSLGNSIASNAYAVTNQISIDPAVIIRAAPFIAKSAISIGTDSENLKEAEKWLETMATQYGNCLLQQQQYTELGKAAENELDIANKELQEVKSFGDMSSEAEYLHKRFFPFGSIESKDMQYKCEAITPEKP